MLKPKARICADIRSQELGVNFNDSHAPVVKWSAMRACLTMAMLNNWHTKEIDFDQTCTQVDCDADVCTHLPAGLHIKNKDRRIIKSIKNSHSLHEGGRNFCEKLTSELENRGHV